MKRSSASIVMTGTPSRSPSLIRFGRRIISPSSSTISAIAATGVRPASLQQVDRGLGVAVALAHAAVDGAQRQDVAGSRELAGVEAGSARTRRVWARSDALMPVL